MPPFVDARSPDPQVVLIELIRDVPADGPKLAPLLHHAVEEGQAKQQAAEGCILLAPVQEAGGRQRVVAVGAQQACTAVE
jgi:hypothetical protein